MNIAKYYLLIGILCFNGVVFSMQPRDNSSGSDLTYSDEETEVYEPMEDLHEFETRLNSVLQKYNNTYTTIDNAVDQLTQIIEQLQLRQNTLRAEGNRLRKDISNLRKQLQTNKKFPPAKPRSVKKVNLQDIFKQHGYEPTNSAYLNASFLLNIVSLIESMNQTLVLDNKYLNDSIKQLNHQIKTGKNLPPLKR